MNAAISALDTGARYDAKLGKLADTLRESTYVLEDTAREVRSYQDDIEFDPETLQLQQERMSAMQGLLRVYGPRMEDVLAARDAAAEAVSLVDDSESRLKQAKKACDEAAAETDKAAEKLDATRKKFAPQFASGVTDQMQHMEMQGASLHVSLERIDRGNWTQKGPSSLEFTFCPGEGLQARPLAKIASGGELSRVLLAIKVVLGAADPADTIVFDEVDAGVGGTAAVALADVLESLSQNHQVIVVTHLAQVAARAQVHAKVEKRQGSDGLPETALRQLTKDERPAEIARMLSGSVTQASLAHARELITG